MGLDPQEPLTKCDEGADLLDPIGIQVMELHVVVVEQGVKGDERDHVARGRRRPARPRSAGRVGQQRRNHRDPSAPPTTSSRTTSREVDGERTKTRRQQQVRWSIVSLERRHARRKKCQGKEAVAQRTKASSPQYYIGNLPHPYSEFCFTASKRPT